MLFPLKGVKVPHHKGTANMPAVKIGNVSTVTIPMSMHIGKNAKPTVAKGDRVYVGTLIAEGDGFVSSCIHSSVSGVVKGFGSMVMPGGCKCETVIIESDAEMTVDPAISAPIVNTKEDFVKAVKDSGIVGLGGAGFPTFVKFSYDSSKSVQELIINCAECEPYITSDTRTMIDRAEDMRIGIENIVKYLSVERVIIGIEKNKKEAILAMKELATKISCADVKVLPSLYPQGGEKVLIYHTTGKVVPAGKLPIDVGCVVCNCTTVAAIGEYLTTGMPLVSKCVTLDGGAVKTPANLVVPIGTSIADLVELAGGYSEEAGKIIMGGPMMGIAVEDASVPIMKNTNAILVFNKEEAKPKRESACIRCGSCAAHCPYKLNPAAFMRAYKKGDMEELKRLRVDICMECGCCTFICPAAKPLSTTNKLSKIALREYLEAEKMKENEEEVSKNG